MVCGILGLLIGWRVETFDWNNLPNIAWPLAYMSIVSVGIGFTGQVIGQRFARPAESAIILSSESVFAALAGAVFLAERLNITGYLGGALILAGIIVVQLFPASQPTLIEQH
jgi:drug/metabolite transporter (DMT)-like permease